MKGESEGAARPRTAGRLLRGVLGAIAGGAAGMLAVVALYSAHPTLALEMDRDPSRIVKGLYGAERVGQETYAWSSEHATLALPGLDRSAEWSCSLRVKAGRAHESLFPEVALSVDGVIVATHEVTNEYRDVEVTIPEARGSSGATVTLTSTKTFVPGTSDKRTLGVMVDRWSCSPAEAGFIRPPSRVVRAAAIGGAAFGAAFGSIGFGAAAVLVGLVAVAFAQAVPLTWAFGVFTAYPDRAAWLALWIAALTVVGIRGTEWLAARPTSREARFAAAFTAVLLYLKLIALVHPSKLPIDVIFNAHRLQWVLDGRLYFTQPMPSGVQFPYAIGLYVFAVPWTWLTSDYVFLLRIIVSTAEAVGAILVYLLISRLWQDRLAGAIAAALFHLVPRTFEIVGNANMPNSFGQSLALAALAAAVLWPLHPRQPLQLAGLTVLTAWALLSHISTLTLLGGILGVLAVLYWLRGGPELRTSARSILGALAAAAVLAAGLYYAHFPDAYRSALRVRASSSAAASGPAADEGAPLAMSTALPSKVREAGRLTVAAVGLPIFLLGIAGLVPFTRRRLRDRLSLAVVALMITFGVFVLSVVLAPVDRSFQRYAHEFISRVTLATYPAIVILAGLAAATALRGSFVLRASACVLVGAAGYVGFIAWIDWLR
jgi:hypothetical protein